MLESTLFDGVKSSFQMILNRALDVTLGSRCERTNTYSERKRRIRRRRKEKYIFCSRFLFTHMCEPTTNVPYYSTIAHLRMRSETNNNKRIFARICAHIAGDQIDVLSYGKHTAITRCMRAICNNTNNANIIVSSIKSADVMMKRNRWWLINFIFAKENYWTFFKKS